MGVAHAYSIDGEIIDMSAQNYDDSVEPCYVFYYTRNINGVLTTYVEQHNGTSTYGNDGDQTYREPWEQEYIEIFLDKDGIASMTWKCPTTVIEYKTESVPILSLDEAKETAIKNLQIIYNAFVPGKNITVHITDVVLGMTRIAVEGEDNIYMFVPAWDFFGYYEYSGSEDQFISERNAYTMLTLNAIDGSIIDRGAEY